MRWLWLPIYVVTAFLAVEASVEGDLGAGIAYVVVGTVLTWWLSPWQGGTRWSRHADVVRRPPGERRVVVYWRPGCVYCARLRGRLGRAGRRALWVNIWQDREAAAYVRSVNQGNETVPTVVLDDLPMKNPDPAMVLARLTDR